MYDYAFLVVGLAVGVFLGYSLVAFFASKKSSSSNNSVKTLVTVAVIIGWFMSIIVEILRPDYQTNTLMHGLMGAIVGFFYKKEGSNGK